MEKPELLALSKYNRSSKVREDVEPGEYDIDVIVRLHGTMKVGADYESEVQSIPWKKVAAILFDKMDGVGIEGVISEALGAVDDSRIGEAASAAMSALGSSTRKVCSGKVTHRLVAEAIELDD